MWPKSHGFPNEGDEPYTDGHHLSACDKWVNNRRSNKDFDAGGTPLCLLPLDNPISNCEVVGASTSTTFDVRAGKKGAGGGGGGGGRGGGENLTPGFPFCFSVHTRLPVLFLRSHPASRFVSPFFVSPFTPGFPFCFSTFS